MSNLPPGPVNYLAPLGLTYRHYLALRLNPISFFSRLARTYGDISFFRVFRHGAVLLNHPELIREVLVRQADNFPKFERVRNHLRQATGDGLLVTEGEKWHQQRVSLQKIFRPNRLTGFFDLTRRYASQLVGSWNCGDSIEIEDEMTDLLQVVMGQGLFGVEVKEGDQISEAVRVYSDIFHYESRALFDLPDWFPLRRKRQKKNTIQTLKSALGEIVTNRIKSGERRDDLLDLLVNTGCPHQTMDLGATNIETVAEEALSQLLTMYVAGFHTTSVALAWLFYGVGNNPEVQGKLVAEIDQTGASSNFDALVNSEFTYVDQVVNESLRLYPAAWELFGRQSIEETELGGFSIPPGTLTMISPWVTHRDPRFFENPEEFDPERFGKERIDKIQPNSFFPFGLGAHHCIGKLLSLVQMKIILVEVLREFEFSVVRGERSAKPVARVSARPKGDITLVLTKRRRSSHPSVFVPQMSLSTPVDGLPKA